MLHDQTLADKILEAVGVNAAHCYQCGKCSAGCPLATDMDLTSSVVMRLLQCREASTDRELLCSNAIWLCLSCEMCVSRCPMEIEIPRIMDFLRQESVREKCTDRAARNVVRFHRSFLDMVGQTGRSSEIGLMLDYKARSGKLTQDLALAPKMLAKGKLSVFPEFIRGRKEIRHIFKKTKP